MATQDGGSFAGMVPKRKTKAKATPKAPPVESPIEPPAKQTRNTPPRGGKRSNPAWKSKGFLVRVETSNRLDLAIARAKIAGESIDQSELIDRLLSDWLDSRGD